MLETELGNVDDLSVQFRAILADNNFAIEPFSDALIRCLPSLPWTPAEESIATRRDLRGIRSITISRTGDGGELLLQITSGREHLLKAIYRS